MFIESSADILKETKHTVCKFEASILTFSLFYE